MHNLIFLNIASYFKKCINICIVVLPQKRFEGIPYHIKILRYIKQYRDSWYTKNPRYERSGLCYILLYRVAIRKTRWWWRRSNRHLRRRSNRSNMHLSNMHHLSRRMTLCTYVWRRTRRKKNVKVFVRLWKTTSAEVTWKTAAGTLLLIYKMYSSNSHSNNDYFFLFWARYSFPSAGFNEAPP